MTLDAATRIPHALAGLAAFAAASSTLASASERALELVEPVVLAWPAEAGPADRGTVTVTVLVGADGRVARAEVLDGPEVFRAEAVEAALRLRFWPAPQADAPPVETVVTFPFEPPAPPELPELDADDGALIVVHAGDPDDEDPRSRSTLDAAALERASGEDFAETASRLAGVTLARGSADASKPVIRGHSERRLLVLQDGVRHESQKWGPDHGTEIDPFSAGEITVIRGASGVRYGPDAIGGVLLVQPPPMREAVGVGGKALMSFASNGVRPYLAARVDAVPAGDAGLSFRAEGSYSRGSSLRAPGYVLGNTASALWNLGVGVRWRRGATTVDASWRRYDLRAGVFYGVNLGTPAEFLAQLDAGRPVTADLWTVTGVIDRPRQEVSHDRVALRVTTSGAFGAVEATWATQINHRREFDQVRASVTGPQFDFTLRTHTVDAGYQHPTGWIAGLPVNGGLGAQGTFQENVYTGLALIPNFRAFSGGVYVTERLSFPRADLEVGARYDHLGRVAYLGESDYERHVRRGTLDETRCAAPSGEARARCPRAYDAGSVSIGGVVHAIPDHLDLKLDLSSASRAPNVDEQYLIGSAPSYPVYALGNPDLGVETTWGGSLTVGARLPWLEAELSGFGQYVRSFIYFAPERNPDGTLKIDVTIRGAWPTYAFRPIDAVFWGMDGAVDLGASWPVGARLRGAVVRAVDAATGLGLVGTPPDRLHGELVGRLARVGPLRDASASVSGELVARQRNVDPAADFAPPPDGFALLGFSAEGRLPIVGGRDLRLGVDVRNALNTTYRDYLSLNRYYADEAGLDVRVRLGVDL